MYGERGRGFIHVHHVKPLSKLKRSQKIDPVNDLRPVCPNCHAMLHARQDEMTVEHLAGLLREGTRRLPT
jgi:5-methylcytosine-specific restriction protein A